MSLQQLFEQINPQTARAFVGAARNLIDALLIEAERIRAAQPPGVIDYDTAVIDRTTPPGGWLAPDELRRATQRLTEALAAEKWLDGMLVALRALRALGG